MKSIQYPGPSYPYLAVLLALSLTSCAAPASRNPYEQFEAVQHSAAPVAADDIQAITNAVALVLQPGRPLEAEITPDDPKIRRDGNPSNYKLFQFQGRTHSRYSIELRSLCDCWGLDKFILYPVARVLDKHGIVMNDQPASLSLSDPDWNFPVNIRIAWEGELENSGPYYFLVSAYNENVGATYLTFTEFDYLASRVQKIPLAAAYLELLNRVGNPSGEVHDPSEHPLWNYPTGKIVVTLSIEPE